MITGNIFKNTRRPQYVLEPNAPPIPCQTITTGAINSQFHNINLNISNNPSNNILHSSVDDQPKYIFPNQAFHIRYGINAVVFGTLIMILDPLVPILLKEFSLMFPAGFLLFIAGISSIHAGWNNNKCCLINTVVFNILSFICFVIAIVVFSRFLSYGNSLSIYFKTYGVFIIIISFVEAIWILTDVFIISKDISK